MTVKSEIIKKTSQDKNHIMLYSDLCIKTYFIDLINHLCQVLCVKTENYVLPLVLNQTTLLFAEKGKVSCQDHDTGTEYLKDKCHVAK